MAKKCEFPLDTNADGEFRGSAKVEIIVSISPYDNRTTLVRQVSYRAWEWDKRSNDFRYDYTQACGTWKETIYTAPKGKRIVRVEGNEDPDIHTYVDEGSSPIDRFSGKMFRKYEANADGDGSDVGRYTWVKGFAGTSLRVILENVPN